MKNLSFHDAANIFPMLDTAAFREFKADIEKNGLREEIEVFEGKIIDGRNRYVACLELGIKCPSREIKTDDPIAFVLSKNLHRRHLSKTQLGMVAARARKFYDEEAKKRQKRKPADSVPVKVPEQKSDARDAAGRAVGVSGKYVDHATRILQNGSDELIEAVDSDKIALSTASRLAPRSAEEQKRALQTMRKGQRKKRPTEEDEHDEPIEPGKSLGVGVKYANEAIDRLKRIPKNDRLRKRGFQIVTDWIRHNK